MVKALIVVVSDEPYREISAYSTTIFPASFCHYTLSFSICNMDSSFTQAHFISKAK